MNPPYHAHTHTSIGAAIRRASRSCDALDYLANKLPAEDVLVGAEGHADEKLNF
jgi:hypothetical protein